MSLRARWQVETLCRTSMNSIQEGWGPAVSAMFAFNSQGHSKMTDPPPQLIITIMSRCNIDTSGMKLKGLGGGRSHDPSYNLMISQISTRRSAAPRHRFNCRSAILIDQVSTSSP